MKTATQYWKEKFGEEPQTDSERLAVAFAASYAEQAIDRCASKCIVERIWVGGEPESIESADKESILKVKNELK